jgi:predicted aspartyl protease
MGITFTKARISNPRQPRRRVVELEFLIDTGAIYSVVPGSIARKLALAKLDREEFTLADGSFNFPAVFVASSQPHSRIPADL